MATLNEIKHRIAGVKSTQKITKAMKVVATTRLKKCERFLLAGEEYLGLIEKAFSELGRSEKLEHPLMQPNEANGKVGVIVISSDRGLCGSFNSMLFRQAEEFMTNELKDQDLRLFLLGAKAEQFYKHKTDQIVYKASRLSDEEKSHAIKHVIDEVSLLFLENELEKVYLIFNHYISRSAFGYKCVQLLPFDRKSFFVGEIKKKQGSFLVEPSIEGCLDILIPLFLSSKMRDAFLQSQTAEELSRMLAMDYATENANELINELTLIYNRTRQEVITKEISEIVGGAEALQ